MAQRSLEPYRDRILPERFHRWVEILRNRIKTIPCYFQGAGSPEGVIIANTGDRYYDETNDTLYIKSTDGLSTGWLAIGGAAPIGVATADRHVALRRRTDSVDSSISFRSGSWDLVNDQALIGGDTGYVGFVSKADAWAPKLTRFAALPTTVIASGNVDHICTNDQGGGGIIARIGNNIARAPFAGTPWTDITNFAATTVHGVRAWKNTIVVKHAKTAGPAHDDISFSTDNGASYTLESTGMNGGTTGNGPRISPNGDYIYVWDIAGNMAFTNSASMPATWTPILMSSVSPGWGGTVANVYPNTDGSIVLVQSSNQDFAITRDFGVTWNTMTDAVNPFLTGGVSSGGSLYGGYSSGFGGWILFNHTTGVCPFWSEANLAFDAMPDLFLTLTHTPGSAIAGGNNLAEWAIDPAGQTMIVGFNTNETMELGPFQP